MTNLIKGPRRGASERFVGGIVTKIVSKYAAISIAAVTALAAFAPGVAQAAERDMSQGEYLKWLVQLSGESHKFNQNSGEQDYVNWARGRGVEPRGGWNARGSVDRDVLAQTVAQFLQLNPGKQWDYMRVLQRAGITLPTGRYSRRWLAQWFDEYLQVRCKIFRKKTPPRPRPDRDDDDDDGHGGGGGGGGGHGDRDDDDGRPGGGGGHGNNGGGGGGHDNNNDDDGKPRHRGKSQKNNKGWWW